MEKLFQLRRVADNLAHGFNPHPSQPHTLRFPLGEQ
jgi:hypothetical protein